MASCPNNVPTITIGHDSANIKLFCPKSFWLLFFLSLFLPVFFSLYRSFETKNRERVVWFLFAQLSFVLSTTHFASIRIHCEAAMKNLKHRLRYTHNTKHSINTHMDRMNLIRNEETYFKAKSDIAYTNMNAMGKKPRLKLNELFGTWIADRKHRPGSLCSSSITVDIHFSYDLAGINGSMCCYRRGRACIVVVVFGQISLFSKQRMR